MYYKRICIAFLFLSLVISFKTGSVTLDRLIALKRPSRYKPDNFVTQLKATYSMDLKIHLHLSKSKHTSLYVWLWLLWIVIASAHISGNWTLVTSNPSLLEIFNKRRLRSIGVRCKPIFSFFMKAWLIFASHHTCSSQKFIKCL